MSRIRKICLLLFVLFYVSPVFALNTDDNQPILSKATYYNIDLIKGIFTYKGDVVMDQGSRHITGDTATIYRKDGKLDKMVITGKPVHYQAKTDDPKKPMLYAKAETMIYEGPKHLLILLTNAEIKQGKDVATSQHIEYQTQQRIVNMMPINGSRSTIVIEPDSVKTQPAAPTSSKGNE
jgi:lipopolysaccharide export system protein LptA